MKITNSLSYENFIHSSGDKIHVTIFNQNCTDSTLLLSKISEAIRPDTEGNHIGEGSNIDKFLEAQKGVRFIINGGFNHYRKNFYDWKHQNFNVGDPVGLVKIREHFFEDYQDISHYGFFTQESKGAPWNITDKPVLHHKYILGCTPLLIYQKEILDIPDKLLEPVIGKINPPSILGHGKQNHPRTAVGIKDSDIYFITVESGFTLFQLQALGIDLELDYLLNLDGGGSSQFRLYHEGEYLQNFVMEEDRARVLGHAIVIFDKRLV